MKTKTQKCIRTVASGLATIAMFGFSSHSLADSQSCEQLERIVNYEVTVYKQSIGSSRREIQSVADCSSLKVSHQLTAGKVARALNYKSYLQVSQLKVNADNSVTPTNVRIERSGKEYEVELDWTNRVAIVNGKEEYEFPDAGEVLDWESWYASLLLRNSDQLEKLTGQSFAIAKHDSFDVYVYEKPKFEQLKTELGKFKTIKLTARLVGKKKRSVTVWLALEQNNLPVKFKTINDLLTFNFDIVSTS